MKIPIKNNSPNLVIVFWIAGLLLNWGTTSQAQSVVNDLLAGKLIDPKPGQWVWYQLRDKDNKPIGQIRQAVVGEEKVQNKKGHWVEFEIVPIAGYKAVYKLLLTGPASDPKNIKRVIHKLGLDPVQELDQPSLSLEAGDTSKAKRKSLGMENVETPAGIYRAEHLEINQDDKLLHLWINEQIKPSGIVRLKTDEGEMVLSSFGSGGEFGKSVLDTTQTSGQFDVQVQATVKTTENESKQQDDQP